MDVDQLRLECLKLAVGRTPDHQEALKRAQDFVIFIASGLEASLADKTIKPRPSVTVGKDDNSARVRV